MSLQVSAAGMSAAERRLNITAHNIANVDTPGYQAIDARSPAFPDAAPASVPPAPAPGTASGDLTFPDAGFGPPSNVDLASEQVNALVDVRAFQANVNAFRAQDAISGELLDLLQ